MEIFQDVNEARLRSGLELGSWLGTYITSDQFYDLQ